MSYDYNSNKKDRCRCRRCSSMMMAIGVLLCMNSYCNVVMSFVIPSSHSSLFAGTTNINKEKEQRRRRRNLHVSVVSTFDSLKKSSNDDDNDDDDDEIKTIQKETKRLSRPERKALERAKKEAKASIANKKGGNRRHNFSEQQSLKKKGGGGGKYNLHSNAISSLSVETTTPDDIMRAIKRAQNLHDAHDIRVIEKFLLEEVDENFAYGYRGSLLSRLAVAALHMNNHKLARKAIDVRRSEYRSSMLPMESAAVIRGLLRVHNTTDAFDMLNDELSLPLQGTSLKDPENIERVKQRALSLASIVSRCFYEDDPYDAVRACNILIELGPIVRQTGLKASSKKNNNDDDMILNMPWTRIIQGASQCESKRRYGAFVRTEAEADFYDDVELPCNMVYAVLNAMTTFPSDNNDRTYEALSNALVRRVLFITGAVSMPTLPKPDRGEAVFIGRSNVGKSSLVNMVTNRKALAYTSKTPGKTQQFNYFAVNDKPGREKEIRYGDVVKGSKDVDSFYIVDVPGFGFAKVPQKQRQQWSDLLQQYVTNRKTLRVVFHLIDARHGPIDEDVNIMNSVGSSLPRNVDYVVVLTKADKNVKGGSKGGGGKVSKSIIDKVRETMKANNVGKSPIILTSAETKIGRDDIWRYLKRAAEY